MDMFQQTLLYVHQEPWQQELMVKYGNTISYKTTKIELALFFVAVKTNVGYAAVADFVLQSETAEQIAEALQIPSSWNPNGNLHTSWLTIQRLRLKPFNVLSQRVKFTFVTSTESKPGRDGSKIGSTFYLLMKETICSTFLEMWLNLLLLQMMIDPSSPACAEPNGE